MASLLVIGAIPSGLAGTVHSAQGLYIIRFFIGTRILVRSKFHLNTSRNDIGILGGTFVPCQVWTTTFFDKNIVGTGTWVSLR